MSRVELKCNNTQNIYVRAESEASHLMKAGKK